MVYKKRKLGLGFPDEVAKTASKTSHFKQKETSWKDTLLPNFDSSFEVQFVRTSWTALIFSAVCIILFFVIFIRLFHLQIVKGVENRELADGNRIAVKVIHAQRGVIFDRSGKILAANSPAFRLFEKTSNGTKKARLITREEALELEVKNDPRSLDLEVDNVRSYPMGEKSAHLIGYVGEISENRLKTDAYKNYKGGDRIGQTGLEAQYEKLLKGIDGGEIVEVDSKGVILRTLRRNPPVPGQNIYLTIDADLQNKLFLEMKEMLNKAGSCCAAAVAMEPKTGQVLALVSFPSFDPNIFTKSYDEQAISQIFTQKNAPILNRVIGGNYPPGSTYKIISSLAALSSGKITQDTIIQDNGVTFLGPYSFANWYFTEYGKVEGSVNLLKAIQRSNDTYYYEIGRRIGEDKLFEWSKKLNLGNKLNIDLPGEEAGLVPNDEWKRKTFNVGWYPGDTLHMAIGQGFLLTTPLQVLGFTSFIASDGVLYKPQLILTNYKPKVIVSNIASDQNIKLIKEGLKLVPKTGGTAWPFFTFPITTAGKTGTAEFGDNKNRTHAWYTSFAPVDDPKIALTVLVEGAGEGSNVSAPIAKEVYRWYFSPDKNNLIKDVYTQATDSGKTLGE